MTAAGCATLPGARPLEPGQHEVGVTIGGPLLDIGPVIPLPMAVVEARHGLTRLGTRPLDLNYGWNTTATAFGVLQLHVGASVLLVHESGFRPAVSVTNRLYGAANLFTPDRGVGVWGLDQLEVAASWAFLNDRLLTWLSVAEYLDFGMPGLLLAPAVGAQFDAGEPGGVVVGLETRYYGLNRRADVDTVSWVPGGNGALGFSFGVSYAFR